MLKESHVPLFSRLADRVRHMETEVLSFTQFKLREVQAALELCSPVLAYLDYKLPIPLLYYLGFVYGSTKLTSWSTPLLLAIVPGTESRRFIKNVVRHPITSMRKLGRQVLDRYDPDFSVRLPREFDEVVECMYDPDMGPGRRLIHYV